MAIPQTLPLYVRGPDGVRRLTLLVDTGATNTVLPASVARALGLPTGASVLVNTDAGVTQWEESRAEVSVNGRTWLSVPVFVAESAVFAVGRTTLDAMGYRLVAAGEERVTDPATRLSICAACEHAVVRPLVGIQCAVCHCVMAVKTRIASASCPVGKW